MRLPRTSRGFETFARNQLLVSTVLASACGADEDACGTDVATLSQPLASTCLREELSTNSGGIPFCQVYVAAAAGAAFCACAEQGYRSTTLTYAGLTRESYLPLDRCAEPPEQPCLCELVPLQGDPLDDCLTMTEVEWQRQADPTYGATKPTRRGRR